MSTYSKASDVKSQLKKVAPLQKELQHLQEIPQMNQNPSLKQKEVVGESKVINKQKSTEDLVEKDSTLTSKYIIQGSAQSNLRLFDQQKPAVKIGSDFETQSRINSIKDDIISICSSYRERKPHRKKGSGNSKHLLTKHKKSKSTAIDKITEQPGLEQSIDNEDDVKVNDFQPQDIFDEDCQENSEDSRNSLLDSDLIESSTTVIETDLGNDINNGNQSVTSKQSYLSYLKRLIMRERRMRQKLEEEFEQLKKFKQEIEKKVQE